MWLRPVEPVGDRFPSSRAEIGPITRLPSRTPTFPQTYPQDVDRTIPLSLPARSMPWSYRPHDVPMAGCSQECPSGRKCDESGCLRRRSIRTCCHPLKSAKSAVRSAFTTGKNLQTSLYSGRDGDLAHGLAGQERDYVPRSPPGKVSRYAGRGISLTYARRLLSLAATA